jgi:putative hydrolase of the HAD superfamily
MVLNGLGERVASTTEGQTPDTIKVADSTQLSQLIWREGYRLIGMRAIAFDAVGTLIHPEPAAPLVYADVGRRYGSRRTPEEIAVRFREAFRREEAFDREHDWRTSEAREIERWRHIVGSVLDDVSDADGCFRELFEHFSRPEAWRCEADVGPTLATLRARGYRLGVASNYDRRLHSVRAGLPELQPLEHITLSAEVGWRKPAAAFFKAVCARMDCPAEALLLVGDDAVNDVGGARSAGLPAVRFGPRWGNTTITGKVLGIERLEELLCLLP